MLPPAGCGCGRQGGHSHGEPQGQSGGGGGRTSSLWTAALQGDVERVEAVLNRGVDVDLRDESGYTALHFAARNNNLDVVRLLLSRRCQLNPQLPQTLSTPLHRAAVAGHVDVVLALIDAKCDVSVRDYKGMTAYDRVLELQRAPAGSHELDAKTIDRLLALLVDK